MTFKQKTHQHYLVLVQDRIDVFKDMIVALTEDSKNDAKGSAGDKHETALAMMHLEQEKLNQKLAENLNQKAIIDKIDTNSNHNKIVLGSLVQANEMWFYISGAMPKIQLDDKTIIAVSSESPLGSQLLGKSEGDTIQINTNKFLIKHIE